MDLALNNKTCDRIMKYHYDKKKFVIFLACFFFLSFSCQRKMKKNERIGEEVIFPSNINWKILGQDTLCPQMLEKEYKVLIYNKSTYCNDCSLKIDSWKDFITKIDTSKTSVLFFINTINNEEEIYTLLKIYEFNYPVIIDKSNTILKTNKFIQIDDIDCFLLDKNNRIILLGNPIESKTIKEEYFKIICHQ